MSGPIHNDKSSNAYRHEFADHSRRHTPVAWKKNHRAAILCRVPHAHTAEARRKTQARGPVACRLLGGIHGSGHSDTPLSRNGAPITRSHQGAGGGLSLSEGIRDLSCRLRAIRQQPKATPEWTARSQERVPSFNGQWKDFRYTEVCSVKIFRGSLSMLRSGPLPGRGKDLEDGTPDENRNRGKSAREDSE